MAALPMSLSNPPTLRSQKIPKNRDNDVFTPSLLQQTSQNINLSAANLYYNDQPSNASKELAVPTQLHNDDTHSPDKVQFIGIIESLSTTPPSLTLRTTDGIVSFTATELSSSSLVAFLRYQAMGRRRVSFSLRQKEGEIVAEDVVGIGEAWTIALGQAENLVYQRHVKKVATRRGHAQNNPY